MDLDNIPIADGKGGFITLSELQSGVSQDDEDSQNTEQSPVQGPINGEFDRTSGDAPIADGKGGYTTINELLGTSAADDEGGGSGDANDLKSRQKRFKDETSLVGRTADSLNKGALQHQGAVNIRRGERLIAAEDEAQQSFDSMEQGARDRAQALFEKHGGPNHTVEDFYQAPTQYRKGRREEMARTAVDEGVQANQAAQEIEQSPAGTALMEAETFEDVLTALKVDPLAIIAEVGLTSLPQALSSMAMGAAGVAIAGPAGALWGSAGGAVGGGFGAGATDFTANFLSGLSQYGVDVEDTESVIAAFRDPELMEQIKGDNDMRAAVIGVASGLSMGVAAAPVGKALTRIPAFKGGIGTRMADVTAKITAGGVLDGAGEYLGEKVEGRQATAGSIAAETIGGLVQAPGDIIAAAWGKGKEGRKADSVKKKAPPSPLEPEPVDDGKFSQEDIDAMNAGVAAMNQPEAEPSDQSTQEVDVEPAIAELEKQPNIDPKLSENIATYREAQRKLDGVSDEQIDREFEEFFGEKRIKQPEQGTGLQAKRIQDNLIAKQEATLTESKGISPTDFVNERKNGAFYDKGESYWKRRKAESAKFIDEAIRPEPIQGPPDVNGYANWALDDDGEYLLDEFGNYVRGDIDGYPLTPEEIESEDFVNSITRQSEIDFDIMLSDFESQLTMNSATAESQANPSSESNVRGVNTDAQINGQRPESTQQGPIDDGNSTGRDSQEISRGQDANIGQQEIDAQPSRGEQPIAARSDEEGSVAEARSESKSRVATPAKRISDQPQRGSAAKVVKARQAVVAESVKRAGQRSNGRVEGFDSLDALPSHLQQSIEQKQAASLGVNVAALYDRATDRIYLDTASVRSENDVEPVIAHEAIHAGLQDLYGSDTAVVKALSDLALSIKEDGFIERKAGELGFDIDQYIDNAEQPNLSDLATVMEEIVARTREKEVAQSQGAVSKLFRQIRDWLNKHGITLPYSESDSGEKAVIDMMRRAQRAYDRTTPTKDYTVTDQQRIDNILNAEQQAELKTKIQASHKRAVYAKANDERSLIGSVLNNANRRETTAQANARLQYRLSPTSMYTKAKKSRTMDSIRYAIKRNLFPKKIVGEFTAEAKITADSLTQSMTNEANYHIRDLNKLFKKHNLKGDKKVALEEAIQNHMVQEVNTTIDPELRAATQAIRSAEITSEMATNVIKSGDLSKVPKNLHVAFRMIMGKGPGKDIARAFVTGKVDPTIPTDFHKTLTAMRLRLDGLSVQILDLVNEQIEDRIVRLTDKQKVDYDDFMAMRGERSRENLGDADDFMGQYGELGGMTQNLIGLHNLHDSISGNLGSYLHRSFKAHDDPNWMQTVMDNEDLKERAVKYFQERYLKIYRLKLEGRAKKSDTKGEEELSEYDNFLLYEQTNGAEGKLPDDWSDMEAKMRPDTIIATEIEARLSDARDNIVVGKGENRSMYGNMDLAILGKRDNVTPIVREILGEYRDPSVNFVKSSDKMMGLIAKQEFLTAIAKELEGSLLFDDGKQPATAKGGNAKESFSVSLSKGVADPMNPIAGKRTTEEFRQALIDWAAPSTYGPLLQSFLTLNGAVKMGLTVYNAGAHIINPLSNGLLMTLNGHFKPEHMRMATRLYGVSMIGDNRFGRWLMGDKYTQNQLREMHIELIKEGVLQDSAQVGELRDILNNAKQSNRTVLDFVSNNRFGEYTGDKVKSVHEKVKNQYQWEDDFFKIVGYLSEIDKNKKLRGMDEDTAKVQAGKRIRDSYPTMSNSVPVVQTLARSPFVGPFVTWAAEMIRVSFNVPKHFSEDYKIDRGRAMARMLAGAAAISATNLIAVASRSLNGVDDEEDELYRQLLMPWETYGTIMYLGRDEDGNLEYIDLSRYDPWSYFKRIANTLTKNSHATTYSKAKEVIIQSMDPFLVPEITATVAGDVLYNSKYGIPGLTIFNDQESDVDKLADIGSYITQGMGPSMGNYLIDGKKAIDGEVSAGGKQYKMSDVIKRSLGFRKGTINLEVAMQLQSSLTKRSVTNSQSIINDVLKNQFEYSREEIEAEFNKMSAARDRNYAHGKRMIDGFKELGLSEEKIFSNMTVRGGLSKADVTAMLNNEKPPYRLSKLAASNALTRSQARAGEDEELRKELKRRFEYKRQVIMELAGQEDDTGRTKRTKTVRKQRESAN